MDQTPSTAAELHERTLATTKPDPGPDASLAYRLSPQVQHAMVKIAFAAFAYDHHYLLSMADSCTRVASGERPRMPSRPNSQRPSGDLEVLLAARPIKQRPDI